MKDEQVEIERKAVSLSAFGIEGNQPIKFQLDIKLLKDIDAENSYWKLDSVGRKKRVFRWIIFDFRTLVFEPHESGTE